MSTTKPQQRPPEPKERDQGFNRSHGYGEGHGGPSGPGDAPAPVVTPEQQKPAKLPPQKAPKKRRGER